MIVACKCIPNFCIIRTLINQAVFDRKCRQSKVQEYKSAGRWSNNEKRLLVIAREFFEKKDEVSGFVESRSVEQIDSFAENFFSCKTAAVKGMLLCFVSPVVNTCSLFSGTHIRCSVSCAYLLSIRVESQEEYHCRRKRERQFVRGVHSEILH